MTNVFVKMREEILVRDKGIQRYMLDARDHEWFWRKAAESFNRSNDDHLDYKLLMEESYPEEVRALNPFYRDGYSVT